MYRTAFALMLSALALAVTAIPAGAAGWSTPQPLPASWLGASLGFDGNGTATAGHLEASSLTPPITTHLGFAQRQANGEWAEQFSLASASGLVPAGVEVAVGTNGAAAACVATYTTGDPATAQEFRLVTYRAAGSASWEPLTPVTTPGPLAGRVTECLPKVTPSGYAAVLVGKDTPTVDSLRLATHPVGGSWSIDDISTPGVSAEWGEMGLDDAGNVTVVWQHRWATGPDRYSVRYRTRTASNGVLGLPTALTPETGTTSAGSPSLAVNGFGAATIAFQIGSHLNASYRPSTGAAWEAPTPVFNDSTASSSAPRSVAVSPGGMAYVFYWRQGPSTSANDVGGMARHGTFGAWTSPASVSPGGANIRDASIVFLGETAVAVYNAQVGGGGGDPGTGIFQAARWPSFASTPEPGVDLATPGPAVTFETALPDNAGSIVALTAEFPTPTTRRWLITAYDAGAPVLVDSAVPPAVTVGGATQLRATFTDLYSPIASVTWDFGDGTPKATGPTVIHAWDAAGPYTVTATARDAVGNETTRSFAVLAAVKGGPPPVDGPSAKDTTPPQLTLALPACKKKQKKAACNAARRKVSSWRTVRGTASDDAALARVTVVATRKKAKRVKAKRITATATLKGNRWSARLKGLSAGKWTITATAVDATGNAKVAKRTVTLR